VHVSLKKRFVWY